MKIAICDDERNIRELIRDKIYIDYPDADVAFYESGEELLASDNAIHIDILFLDIQMEGRNGS